MTVRSHQQTSCWQFAPYFHFAEPLPPGVVAAYAGSVMPGDEYTDSAEALRAAEVEAVRMDDSDDTVVELSPWDALEAMKLDRAVLESMTIDELRAVANGLDVPPTGDHHG